MNLPSGATFSPNERHLQDPVGFGRVFLGEELVTIPSEEHKQVVRFPKPHRLVTPLAVRGEDCVHLNGDLFDAHAVVEPVPVRPGATPIAPSMRRLAELGIVSGESGAATLAGLAAICQNPIARMSLGIDHDSRILLLSTEGATDPEIYKKLVGVEASEIVTNLPI